MTLISLLTMQLTCPWATACLVHALQLATPVAAIVMWLEIVRGTRGHASVIPPVESSATVAPI